MLIHKSVLLCILLLTLDPILGKRSFGGSRHSYPKSGGLSGGGHSSGGLSGGGHGYPSSGGSHGYPSGGLSGGGHGYPSSGGGHSYPSSGGNHGYPSSGGNPGYPSSGNRGYPSSGQSGGAHGYPSSNNHGYPASGGLSGGGHGYQNKPTNTYNNYHYSPPSQINYAPTRGAPPVSYPVYHGPPPTYVYQYKDSGSKYGTLLAGLALMNLGTLGVAAYAAHKSTQNQGSGGSYTYKPQPGEVCKFAIKKENGDYEETRIDCQIISGFILQDIEAARTSNNSNITTITTVTNTTIINATNVEPDQTTTSTTTAAPGKVLYEMLTNGTLVPVNVTGVPIPGLPESVANGTAEVHNETAPSSPNNTATSSVTTITTTTTNTTLVSALDVKGKPVEVTPGMQCFVIRHTPMSHMKKTVPCGLLQTYAEKSIQRSSASRNMPLITMAVALLAYCVA